MKLLTPQEALQALQNGKKVECLIEGLKTWHNVLLFSTGALANANNKFRLAQEMITIGGVSFPKPVIKPLERGAEYWIADPSEPYYTTISSCRWEDDKLDNCYLRRGIIHLSEENAIAHTKALVKLSGGNVNE